MQIYFVDTVFALLFLHAEADEEIEGKGPGEVSATVGRHS